MDFQFIWLRGSLRFYFKIIICILHVLVNQQIICSWHHVCCKLQITNCIIFWTQVWASGFSAALMKKHSVTTKGLGSNDSRSDVLVVESNMELKPAATEAVLLSALETFFDVVLNTPRINRYACCPRIKQIIWVSLLSITIRPFQLSSPQVETGASVTPNCSTQKN